MKRLEHHHWNENSHQDTLINKKIKAISKQKKSYQEQLFIAHLKEIGIKSWGKTYERGNWYWFFDLANGERRYWTNLSKESSNELGIKDGEPHE